MTKKPEKQMSKSKPASSFKLFIKLFKDYSGSNLVLWLPIFLGLLLSWFYYRRCLVIRLYNW
nr:hypothetical protein [Mycoplasmopsis bovis]